MTLRSTLLTDKIRDLALNQAAPMPSETQRLVEIKKKTRESIMSRQRLQRMHLVRGERNE